MSRHSIGDQPVITYRLRVNGVLTPGATVTGQVRNPAGATFGAPIAAVDAGGGAYTLTLPALTSSGRWSLAIDSSGTGSDDLTLALYVTEAAADLPWAPSLADVGNLVPMRTTELGNLTGVPAGTFTPLTMPDDVAVSGMVDGAVQRVSAAVGDVDEALWPAASDVAALYAAARVELAQPSDQQDARRYAQLIELADTALAELVERNEQETGVSVDADSNVVPSYAYPEPVAWGDAYL